MDPEFLKVLFGDSLKTVEVFAELLRPQWKGTHTYEEVSDLILGDDDSFLRAKDALNAGLIDFFRRLDQPAMAALVEKSAESARELVNAMLGRVTSQKVNDYLAIGIERTLKDFDEAIDREFEKIRGRSSGS
jgi:hypothetical protein